jgi:hypothetical protein
MITLSFILVIVMLRPFKQLAATLRGVTKEHAERLESEKDLGIL